MINKTNQRKPEEENRKDKSRQQWIEKQQAHFECYWFFENEKQLSHQEKNRGEKRYQIMYEKIVKQW